MALPSPEHHHIVYLQGEVLQIPTFALPPPYTYSETIYPRTAVSDVSTRIHNASILVVSALRVDAHALAPETSPCLKLIVVVASGIDCIDLDACRKRGIVVSNCPNSNVEAVSEHAIGLYFATRRKLLEMHLATRAGEWSQKGFLMYKCLDKDGMPPLTCQDEVAGIIGNGSVGKRIALLARNLGMKVIISDRKTSDAAKSSEGSDDSERVPFDLVIKQSTVLFIALPLMDSTRNLLSTIEFESMSPHAVLVNVSRGGIVNEEALIQALEQRNIFGAATDVFREEPAGPGNSPLLRENTQDLNLVTTPHLAWLSQKTSINYSQKLKQAVEAWCAGGSVNVVT
ncbi:hypothetical protein P175DRAFT_0522158 [Aspergillus ochraceoroseus IBT 24754]|uniref:D-isomer specific 2-hydroxyacid dehydrogenase NAD-binding domain-containing protein n=1 Tax=Aspergillus ochraceoroseus IBT 24754 TaxID=1392256 RepID=A0A2T5M3J3_9EURO|nr:uncharacterized protein P175DRAFT_0522158 [Aspergillus ochraceoroseus IBT 24754]PTU23086.1 hypothetical protein P175DRAFT_0522158 [Aspergillus ochraceoroseus IBT 24754]